MSERDLGFEKFLNSNGVYRDPNHLDAIATLQRQFPDLAPPDDAGFLYDNMAEIRQYCATLLSFRKCTVRDCSLRGAKLLVVLSNQDGTYISVSHLNERVIFCYSINNITIQTINTSELEWTSSQSQNG